MTEDRDRAVQQTHGTPPESAPGGVRHDTFTVTLRLSVSPAPDTPRKTTSHT